MDITLIGMAAGAALVAIVWVYLFINMYQRCGPNQVLIITGYVPGGIKVVRRGGTVVFPLIMQRNSLSLEIITVAVRSEGAMLTKNNVPVSISGTAHVKISDDDESVVKAAQRFLNKSTDEMAAVAHKVLLGHLRALVATMTVEEITQSLGPLAQTVQQVSTADLAKMGLTVEFFAIETVNDMAG